MTRPQEKHRNTRHLSDIDGELILDLPEIDDDERWHLHDDDGSVHVTEHAGGLRGRRPTRRGYSIHSPLDAADLDGCNGHTTDELGDHEYAHSAEQDNVLTCFAGATVAGATDAGPGPGGGGGGGGPQD